MPNCRLLVRKTSWMFKKQKSIHIREKNSNNYLKKFLKIFPCTNFVNGDPPCPAFSLPFAAIKSLL